MKPIIIVKRSLWSIKYYIIFCTIFFWLILPILLLIYNIIKSKTEKIELYINKIVIKNGWLTKKEKTIELGLITDIKLLQNEICKKKNYGHLIFGTINLIDYKLKYIIDPQTVILALKSRLL